MYFKLISKKKRSLFKNKNVGIYFVVMSWLGVYYKNYTCGITIPIYVLSGPRLSNNHNVLIIYNLIFSKI